MPRGPSANTVQRRDGILEAALRCFLENGIAATTIEDIRERSKASTGSIYHHFGSKEELAAELYLSLLREYQAGALAELYQTRPPRETVEGLIVYHLRWVKEHPNWSRYLFEMRSTDAIRPVEGEIASLNQEFAHAFHAWARHHIREGAIRNLPTDIIVALLLGPPQTFARFWLAGATRTAVDRAADLLAASAWNSLRSDLPDGR